MKTLKISLILLSLFVAMILASCGGGGSSNSDGGIEGTGLSRGSITGFGSIIVNGVAFDTSGADISIDDIPGLEGDLKIGMVVTVQGSINGASGIATSVSSEDVVKGKVDKVAPDKLSIEVLGQTILIDNTTIIDNRILDIGNLLGTFVKVHGFVKDKGVIAASFIEPEFGLTEFRVKGFVENANLVTFTIGMLTIDYSNADTTDLPGGIPMNGQLVEVKGSPPNPPVANVLIANKVELEGLDVADAPDAEMEGFITSVGQISPTADFVVEGQPVITTGSTVFSGGLQSEVAVGLKVEVEGTLAGGVLTADKVAFKDSIKLESDVDSVDLINNELTLKGLGIVVQVNSQTEFKGEGDPISLSDFADGNHVRVRGRPSGSNTVVASELELRNPGTDVVLQGPVDTVTNPTLSIFGITVDTTDILDNNKFEGLDDMPIGRAAFFATVQPGDLVKAQGVLDVGVITWDEIELED